MSSYSSALIVLLADAVPGTDQAESGSPSPLDLRLAASTGIEELGIWLDQPHYPSPAKAARGIVAIHICFHEKPPSQLGVNILDG